MIPVRPSSNAECVNAAPAEPGLPSALRFSFSTAEEIRSGQ